MSHKLPHDAASLQRLINDVHIRLQAVAMEWADMRAVNRDDILRPYWIIGLRTEIVGYFGCLGRLLSNSDRRYGFAAISVLLHASGI
jgi:hypothetical protein